MHVVSSLTKDDVLNPFHLFYSFQIPKSFSLFLFMTNKGKTSHLTSLNFGNVGNVALKSNTTDRSFQF